MFEDGTTAAVDSVSQVDRMQMGLHGFSTPTAWPTMTTAPVPPNTAGNSYLEMKFVVLEMWTVP